MGPAAASTISIGNIEDVDDEYTGVGLQGQQFVIPEGATHILRAGLLVFSNSDAGELSIRSDLGDSHALLGDPTSFTAVTGATSIFRELTIPAGGIPVTPGSTYVLQYTGGALHLASDYYPHGKLRDGHGNRDAKFLVEFAVADPTPVPTTSQWTLIGLGLAIAGSAGVAVARRRRQAA